MVNMSLYSFKHHDMKAYAVVELYLHVFLTKELGGGNWTVLRHQPF
jgi:hypothetical protein